MRVGLDPNWLVVRSHVHYRYVIADTAMQCVGTLQLPSMVRSYVRYVDDFPMLFKINQKQVSTY